MIKIILLIFERDIYFHRNNTSTLIYKVETIYIKNKYLTYQ